MLRRWDEVNRLRKIAAIKIEKARSARKATEEKEDNNSTINLPGNQGVAGGSDANAAQTIYFPAIKENVRRIMGFVEVGMSSGWTLVIETIQKHVVAMSLRCCCNWVRLGGKWQGLMMHCYLARCAPACHVPLKYEKHNLGGQTDRILLVPRNLYVRSSWY